MRLSEFKVGDIFKSKRWADGDFEKVIYIGNRSLFVSDHKGYESIYCLSDKEEYDLLHIEKKIKWFAWQLVLHSEKESIIEYNLSETVPPCGNTDLKRVRIPSLDFEV